MASTALLAGASIGLGAITNANADEQKAKTAADQQTAAAAANAQQALGQANVQSIQTLGTAQVQAQLARSTAQLNAQLQTDTAGIKSAEVIGQAKINAANAAATGENQANAASLQAKALQQQEQSVIAQGKAAEYNTDLANQNATLVEQQYLEEERRQRVTTQGDLANIKVGYSAAGIELSGSALDVLAANAANGELNALTIRSQGALKAREFRNTATLDAFQAQNAKATAGLIEENAQAVQATAGGFRQQAADMSALYTDVGQATAKAYETAAQSAATAYTGTGETTAKVYTDTAQQAATAFQTNAQKMAGQYGSAGTSSAANLLQSGNIGAMGSLLSGAANLLPKIPAIGNEVSDLFSGSVVGALGS